MDSTPLLSAASPALLDELAFPTSDYGARFVDLSFWRPYIELVAAAHGLPTGELAMGEPGSFPTFILGGTHVVKFFGVPLDGPRCWAVERAAAQLIADAGASIPMPDVIAAGSLARAPDWRYLVTAFVPGKPFASARDRLTAPARIDVASALGRLVRRLHEIPIPTGTAFGSGWSGWVTFIEGQRRNATERHRIWGTLPERLLGEIGGYLIGYRAPEATPPALVHADLHDHHVLGEATKDGWAIRGVIDWGDARAGDFFYELPALHLGLFRGGRAMLGAFLAAYGWPGHRSGAFARRAMAITLLHEFNVLDGVGELVDLERIASLDELAGALWRV